MPLDRVATHHDVPELLVSAPNAFKPSSAEGVSKHVAPLGHGAGMLRTLLVNRLSDILIVAFHGATNRRRKEIPRFEWFRTLRSAPYSCMFISDPLLETDPTLELAWYTGTYSLNLQTLLAEWAQSAANAIGSTQIIFVGSSGGGFAALQVAVQVKNSLASPFNPQTAIANYRVGGTDFGAQKKFLRTVMPELMPGANFAMDAPGSDWSEPLALRLSSVVAYGSEYSNYVFYAQNSNDVNHLDNHYEPFLESVRRSSSSHRIHFDLYDGAPGHNPPSPRRFLETIGRGVSWHSRMLNGPV